MISIAGFKAADGQPRKDGIATAIPPKKEWQRASEYSKKFGAFANIMIWFSRGGNFMTACWTKSFHFLKKLLGVPKSLEEDDTEETWECKDCGELVEDGDLCPKCLQLRREKRFGSWKRLFGGSKPTGLTVSTLAAKEKINQGGKITSKKDETADLVFFVKATTAEKGLDIAEAVWREFQIFRPGVLVENKLNTWAPKMNSLIVTFNIRCKDFAEVGTINEELNRLFAEVAARKRR